MKHFSKFLLLLIILGCAKENDAFLITKHNVGMLNDSTQVRDLSHLFPNDSISIYNGDAEFTSAIHDIDIYDASGKLLLVLTPEEALDSTSTIKTVKIVDARYKTKKGLNSKATFKDIRDHYKINSVQNTITNVVITVNELNAYFTIDKKELPNNMRFDMNLKIEPIQIPDEAKIKNFYLHWY